MNCPQDEAHHSNILTLIAFTNKSISNDDKRYNYIERKVLGIPHGLEKFQLYCFAREVTIIMDHKPLEQNFKKDAATQSHRFQLLPVSFRNN